MAPSQIINGQTAAQQANEIATAGTAGTAAGTQGAGGDDCRTSQESCRRVAELT